MDAARACPGCGERRRLGPGDPTVERCRCGAVWCWMCGDRLRAKDVPATTDVGLGRRDLARLSGAAELAGLAAVHHLVGRPWHRALHVVAERVGAAPARKKGAAVTCPAYLELVELECADRFGPPGTNRDAWDRVARGAMALRG